MKPCSNYHCESKGVLLDLSEFHKNKNNKDGLESQCKKCKNASRLKSKYNHEAGTLKQRVAESQNVRFT